MKLLCNSSATWLMASNRSSLVLTEVLSLLEVATHTWSFLQELWRRRRLSAMPSSCMVHSSFLLGTSQVQWSSIWTWMEPLWWSLCYCSFPIGVSGRKERMRKLGSSLELLTHWKQSNRSIYLRSRRRRSQILLVIPMWESWRYESHSVCTVWRQRSRRSLGTAPSHSLSTSPPKSLCTLGYSSCVTHWIGIRYGTILDVCDHYTCFSCLTWIPLLQHLTDLLKEQNWEKTRNVIAQFQYADGQQQITAQLKRTAGPGWEATIDGHHAVCLLAYNTNRVDYIARSNWNPLLRQVPYTTANSVLVK